MTFCTKYRNGYNWTLGPKQYGIQKYLLLFDDTYICQISACRTTGGVQGAYAQSMYVFVERGHWNDPNMLEICDSGLSLNKQKVHFWLLAVIALPLLIGADLLEIPQ